MVELSVTLWKIKSDLSESLVGTSPSYPSVLTVSARERHVEDYTDAGTAEGPDH